jgi:hypothetical protein
MAKPNRLDVGDPVEWIHPVSGDVLRGTVLEIGKNKKNESLVWFETAEGKRHCVPNIQLRRPDNEAKAAGV